ncbi:hypothetical protein GBAR_LOCUS17215 [Geodia barretti]|uniref:Uncharacterized protein n=1 Tax=Geodia barretti TaxID=519541 RepID=A0AA35SI24_GEOBA|nr:hypothetical protein GBAR_LOCUS17215 [Geodia barretti]
MERKLNTPSSSSAGSGTDNRKVPTIVRTETRKIYKTLLDGDEFTGFDLSPGTTYKDSVNQSVAKLLVKEVCTTHEILSCLLWFFLCCSCCLHLLQKPLSR